MQVMRSDRAFGQMSAYLQCAYREPGADREPHADRQPDDEPFASITHGDTSCASARPAPPASCRASLGSRTRTRGEAAFGDSKRTTHAGLPARAKAAHHAIPCSVENRPGAFFPQIPLPERVKAPYNLLVERVERLVPPRAEAFEGLFPKGPTRDLGRLEPSRAQPFAFRRTRPRSLRNRGTRRGGWRRAQLG